MRRSMGGTCFSHEVVFGLDQYLRLSKGCTCAHTCNRVYLEQHTKTPGKDIRALQSSQSCRVPVQDESPEENTVQKLSGALWEAYGKPYRQSGMSSKAYPHSE